MAACSGAWLAVVCSFLLLAACGGHVASPEQPAPVLVADAVVPAAVPAAQPAASAPVVAAVPDPAPSAPAAAPVVKAPAPVPPVAPAPPVVPALPPPVVLWAEPWAAPVFGGYIVQPVIDCKGQPADPQDGEVFASFAAADTWGLFGNRAQIKAAIVSATGGRLVVDSLQDAQAGGWAILSAARFDPAVQLELEGVIELQPDPGAWVSLPLIHGEGDYRQISLREDGGRISADLGAPCFWQPLGTYPPGPRLLSLRWTPGVGWDYLIDGVLLLSEPITHNRADLAGPVRAGLYVVNVDVESRRLPAGRVRATVGDLKVTTWNHQ